jgi:hypothetical protein
MSKPIFVETSDGHYINLALVQWARIDRATATSERP